MCKLQRKTTVLNLHMCYIYVTICKTYYKYMLQTLLERVGVLEMAVIS